MCSKEPSCSYLKWTLIIIQTMCNMHVPRLVITEIYGKKRQWINDNVKQCNRSKPQSPFDQTKSLNLKSFTFLVTFGMLFYQMNYILIFFSNSKCFFCSWKLLYSTGSGSEIVTPHAKYQKTGQYAKLVQVREFSSHWQEDDRFNNNNFQICQICQI